MTFSNLSPETAALVKAGILAPTVALQAGEVLTPCQVRGLWAAHRQQQRAAQAAIAAWRRAV